MTASTDLFTLVLVDGIPATVDGKTIRYREVRLRETNVADERAALRAAERVVLVNGAHKLLVSEGDYRFALTMRHIASLHCDGLALHQGSLDLDLFGQLSGHDLGLIEQRILLINVAAQVRYGLATEEQFAELASAVYRPKAPQPSGPASVAGANAAAAESGPALLADFAGAPTAGAVSGAGK